MKKAFITLLILLSAIVSFAQYPNQAKLPGSTPKTVVFGTSLALDSNLTISHSYTDTSEANVGFIKNIPGAIIRVGNDLFMRKSCICEWQLIGGVSSADSIYFTRPLYVNGSTVFMLEVNGTDTGYVTPTFYNYWNGKVDSVVLRGSVLRSFAFGDSSLIGAVGGSTFSQPSQIISSNGLNLTDSTLTIYPVTYQCDEGPPQTTDTFTTIINSIESGYFQSILFYIPCDGGGIDSLQSVKDTIIAITPLLPDGGIYLTVVDLDGGTITPPIISSTYQRTAVVFIDSATGLANTDSLWLSYQKGIKELRAHHERLTGSLNFPNAASRIVFSSDATIFGGNGYLNFAQPPGKFNFNSANATFMRFEKNAERSFIDLHRVLIGAASYSDTSAILSLVSTTKAFLPPRMTAVQMNAITSPVAGMQVWNTTDSTVYQYRGFSGWSALGSGWGLNGNAGTSELTDFIGTTDNVPLYLRVNNDTVAKFGVNTYNISFAAGVATGAYSFAGGNGIAYGEASVAFGGGANIAYGGNSFAIGSGPSMAFGDNSMSTGNGTYAYGDNSISTGYQTKANGHNSISSGTLTISKSKNSLVIGRNNDTTGQSNNDTLVLFQIGNGYVDGSDIPGTPSNLLTATYTGVGIGTTTPSYKLDVQDTVNALAYMLNGVPFTGGGSSVGDSLVKAYDSLAAHNIRIGANTTNIAANTSNISLKLNKSGDTASYIGFPLQAVAPSTPTTGFRLYANSNGYLTWKGQNGFTRTLNGSYITGNRVLSIQDKSYTIADSADVALKANITSPTLITPVIGAASGTSLVLGGTIGSSAILDVQSTSKGFLKPRMTTAQILSISSPVDGLEAYSTDEGIPYYYSNDWGWTSNDPVWNTKNGITIYSDLGWGVQSGSDIQSYVSGGAINSVNSGVDASHQTVTQLSTSTSATGIGSVIFASSTIGGGGRTVLKTSVRLPTLSNGTQRYQFIAGFNDALATNAVDGIYILYDEGGVSTGSAASANWQTVTSSNSTRTFTTTSTAVATTAWVNLEIVINAAGTSVDFKVNGTTIATHTTNIPTGTTRIYDGFIGIIKSTGTTASVAQLDYIYYKQKFTTAR